MKNWKLWFIIYNNSGSDIWIDLPKLPQDIDFT